MKRDRDRDRDRNRNEKWEGEERGKEREKGTSGQLTKWQCCFFGARPFFKVMRMPRGVCEVTGSRLEARGSLGGVGGLSCGI